MGLYVKLFSLEFHVKRNKSFSPHDETIRNVFLIFKHNNFLFARISKSVLLWVANKNSRVDLERHTFVGSLNSLDSNINNAVATNFFIINVFWNDVSVIEWGKITYLYWYSFHLSNINSKRTYHKITRYLSWLLKKKTTGNMLVYFIWSWFIQG